MVFATIASVIAPVLSLWAIVLVRSNAAAIQLMRDEMSHRLKLEAEAESERRVAEWLREISPAQQLVVARARAARVPTFVRPVRDLYFYGEDIVVVQRACAWWNALPPELSEEISALLDRLEIWSRSFVVGLAESRGAVPICAEPFCRMVEYHFPAILALRSGALNRSRLSSTLQLFKSWHGLLGRSHAGNLHESQRPVHS